MRLAVLILGLLLGLVMFIQSFLVAILGGLAEDESISGAGAVGIFVAIFWLVACAFVIFFPLLSTILLGLAGLMAYVISGTFPAMTTWGTISLVLAVMSFAGWRGKKRDDNARKARESREQERDELLTNLLREQGAARVIEGSFLESGQKLALAKETITCPRCGATGLSLSTRFCPNCGLERTAEPTA